MNNDGGWCWHPRMTQIGGRLFGVKMHVERQPHHGEVGITILEHETRIAYRPNPEFFGTDEFSVNNDMYNIERIYKVVVKR